MSYTGRQMRDALSRTPQSVRDVLSSDALDTVYRELITQMSLSKEQVQVLADEMNYTLLGLEPVSTFQQRMISAGMKQDYAKTISHAFDTRVFASIGRELMEFEEKLRQEKKTRAAEDTISLIDSKLTEPTMATKQSSTAAPAPAKTADPYRETF